MGSSSFLPALPLHFPRGESTPRKPDRMLSDYPCLVLCWGPNPHLTETVLDLFYSVVLHQLLSGGYLLQGVTPVSLSILYHLFLFIYYFLLAALIFPCFTDSSSFLYSTLHFIWLCSILSYLTIIYNVSKGLTKCVKLLSSVILANLPIFSWEGVLYVIVACNGFILFCFSFCSRRDNFLCCLKRKMVLTMLVLSFWGSAFHSHDPVFKRDLSSGKMSFVTYLRRSCCGHCSCLGA